METEQRPNLPTLYRRPSWINRNGFLDRVACLEVTVADLRRLFAIQVDRPKGPGLRPARRDPAVAAARSGALVRARRSLARVFPDEAPAPNPHGRVTTVTLTLTFDHLVEILKLRPGARRSRGSSSAGLPFRRLPGEPDWTQSFGGNDPSLVQFRHNCHVLAQRNREWFRQLTHAAPVAPRPLEPLKRYWSGPRRHDRPRGKRLAVPTSWTQTLRVERWEYPTRLHPAYYVICPGPPPAPGHAPSAEDDASGEGATDKRSPRSLSVPKDVVESRGHNALASPPPELMALSVAPQAASSLPPPLPASPAAPSLPAPTTPPLLTGRGRIRANVAGKPRCAFDALSPGPPPIPNPFARPCHPPAPLSTRGPGDERHACSQRVFFLFIPLCTADEWRDACAAARWLACLAPAQRPAHEPALRVLHQRYGLLWAGPQLRCRRCWSLRYSRHDSCRRRLARRRRTRQQAALAATRALRPPGCRKVKHPGRPRKPRPLNFSI